MGGKWMVIYLNIMYEFIYYLNKVLMVYEVWWLWIQLMSWYKRLIICLIMKWKMQCLDESKTWSISALGFLNTFTSQCGIPQCENKPWRLETWCQNFILRLSGHTQRKHSCAYWFLLSGKFWYCIFLIDSHIVTNPMSHTGYSIVTRSTNFIKYKGNVLSGSLGINDPDTCSRLDRIAPHIIWLAPHIRFDLGWLFGMFSIQNGIISCPEVRCACWIINLRGSLKSNGSTSVSRCLSLGFIR